MRRVWPRPIHRAWCGSSARLCRWCGGPVWAGSLVFDVRSQGVFEREGAVAGPVVRQHTFDRYAAGFEVGVGAFPEPGSGFLLGLVGARGGPEPRW